MFIAQKGSITKITWLLAAIAMVMLASVSITEAKVTVTSWSPNHIEPLVAAFNAKNLDVEAEAVVVQPDALKTRLISDTAPDIAYYHVAFFDYAWEQYWLDLTDMVRAADQRDWLPGTWDAVTISQGPCAGQLHRIKNTYEVPVFYYDKDKIANAGQIAPAELHKAGRWTWDNMLGLAKKLTRDVNGDGQIDIWGLAHDQSFGWKSSGYYEIWGLQSGQYFVSSDGQYQGNQPAFVNAVQWWADLFNVHHVMQSARPSYNTLPRGTSAMTMYGSHIHISGANWQQYNTYDMAPLPNLPEQRAYNYMYEHGSWVVNKDSKHMADTLKFVEFLLSKEATQIMSKQVGFFPVRLSVVREFADYQRERYPWAENIAYTIISSAESTMLPTKPGPWYTPNWNAVRDHVNSAVQLVQAGQAPAAIALQQVADPIQHLLDSGRDQMIPGRL